MLHRSFKPAKCKTSLKLATSRTKLLKNKKGVQVNQMKKELAQLLESGQDQTARIRVEHVIREEKMIGAYDLIEIYSELIAARLPIIESQKNCPIDLKEAIASVIFASPRCADIPELLDVRKHFTAKYGKEFITAAIELRPNSGVSRMLVEKLSAVAPDGQTKMKVLNAIADEHNIKWEPKAFGEKDPKPPDDLLSGPNTFDKAGRPPKFEVPNVQAPANHDQQHDERPNLSEQSIRSSVGTQNFSSADTGGVEKVSATSHDMRHSGMGSERMEVRKPFAGDDDAFSRGKQNWNMEFKDATSAAQAAAESAERASMAARVAAELSSRGRITRQYSTESQKSNIHGQRDGGPRKDDTSQFPGEYYPKDSVHNSFHDINSRLQVEQTDGKHKKPARATDLSELDSMPGAGLSSRGKISRQDTAESPKLNVHDASKFPSERIPEDAANSRNSKIQNEQRDGNERDNLVETADRFYADGRGSVKRSSRSSSLRSSKVSMDDEKMASRVQKADQFSRESSFEEETIKAGTDLFSSEISMKKQSRVSEDEHVSGRQDSFKSANYDYFGEERMRRQSSLGSSHSHTSDFGDGYSASNSKNAVENPFVGIDYGSTRRDTTTTTVYDADALAFDGSGSDDESSRFDVGAKYDEGESNSYFSSPVRKSPTHPSIDRDSWSPRRNMNNLVEKSTSQPHFSAEEKHSSPTFTEGLENSSSKFSPPEDLVPVSFDDSDAPDSESEDELEKSMPSGTKDSSECHSGYDKMTWLSSSGDLDSTEAEQKNEEVTELFMSSSKKFNFGKMSASRPSPSRGKSRVELNDLVTDSVYEVEDSDRTPVSPYTMKDNEFLKQSSSKGGKELNLGTLTGGLRNKGYRKPPYTSRPSGDVSSTPKNEDEESSTVIEHTIVPNVKSSFNSRVSTDTDKKSRPGAVISHSDSDTDDSTEAFPRETISSSQELYAQMATKEVRAMPSVRRPVTYMDSDSGHSEEGEGLPKKTLPTRNRFGSGVSRRTKAFSSNVASSYSKVQDGSEASADSKYAAERKPTKSSYGAETPLGPRSQTENPAQLGSYEQTSSAKQRASKPMPESNFLFPDGSEASVSSSSEDERIPTRSSYSAESPPKARSSRGSDQWRSREQPSSAKQAASKPIPESKPKVRDESAASLVSNFGVERASTRSSYGAETPPRHQSQTGSSDQWESREQPSSAKQVASKPIMESKTKVRDETVASVNSSSGAERSSIRGSHGAETPPKYQSQTGSSDQWGSRKQPSSANEPKPKVSSESVTSVNLNSGAERISTSSYAAETPPKHRSQTGNSDQWGSRKQPSSADEPKPKVSSESVTLVSSNSRAERISTSSYGAETPSKHRSQTGNSDQWGSRERPSSADEPKPKVSSESVTSVSSNSRAERISTSSYGAETPPKHRSHKGSADQLGSREQSSSGKQVATKPVPESKFPSREGSLKKSAVHQTSSPQRKASSPGSSENPKTSTLSESASIKENTDKRASHVHPKLPDYETLAAQFQSLRTNRK